MQSCVIINQRTSLTSFGKGIFAFNVIQMLDLDSHLSQAQIGCSFQCQTLVIMLFGIQTFLIMKRIASEGIIKEPRFVPKAFIRINKFCDLKAS